jgi:ADP-heptose:LPS heptosyltransferase
MPTVTADPVLISRWSGLGDVCMALCAAHAFKAVRGGRVTFCTDAKFHPLARACPSVDEVVSDPFEASTSGHFRDVPLHAAYHGLQPYHEVESFLAALGINETVDPRFKTLELRPDDDATRMIQRLLGTAPPEPRHGPRRVLLHTGCIDPNRTWPEAHWIELAERLLWQGFDVFVIGGKHTAFTLEEKLDPMAPTGRLFDLVGKLSILETVELMRRSSVLVSTDGGPLQLAGATDIAILGLYSVVHPACRLPHRCGMNLRASSVVPECSCYPCYLMSRDPNIWERESRRMNGDGIQGLGPMLGHWCPVSADGRAPFQCMNREILPAAVFHAVMDLF